MAWNLQHGNLDPQAPEPRDRYDDLHNDAELHTPESIPLSIAEQMIIHAALRHYRMHPSCRTDPQVATLTARFATLLGFPG